MLLYKKINWLVKKKFKNWYIPSSVDMLKEEEFLVLNYLDVFKIADETTIREDLGFDLNNKKFTRNGTY